MEITKREIVASVSIIAILLILGFVISSKISDNIMDKNAVYNKALKIDNKEIFEYGMKTNVGNAFVYGDLEVLDPVTYPEIGGEYSYVKKVKERYTMHTRMVKVGKSYHTQIYWTWDVVGKESVKSKKAVFLGVEFNFSQFIEPNDSYINTIKESSHVRYKYYGSPIKVTGTIFTKLENNNIGQGIKIYENMKIDETFEYLKSDFSVGLFWIIWLVLIMGCVWGFYYLDNRWLNKE